MANKSKVVSNLPNNGSGRKKKEVVAFNYLENKITIYADVSTASWNEGVSINSIKYRLNKKSLEMVGGVAFMYLEETRGRQFPARTADEINLSVDKHMNSDATFVVLNHANGFVGQYLSVKSIGELVGVSANVISTKIRKADLWPVKGYSIKRSNDKREFPKLTEDELWVNLNRASSQVFGYTLDYHGKHEVYLTLAEITNVTGLPSTKIQSQLLEGGGSFVYRGFQITSLARP